MSSARSGKVAGATHRGARAGDRRELSGSASNAAAAADAEALQRGRNCWRPGRPPRRNWRSRQALPADPSSVEAHLGLARSYYALGEYARAVIEFEAVLRYDNLPRDLQSQAETYDRVAAGYVTRRLGTVLLRRNRHRQLPAEQLGIHGHFRWRRQLRHVPADPRRWWLEQGRDRAPFVQWHAGLPLPLVRRHRPAQRLRPALELQPEPPGGRRQPALRHARTGELPGRWPAPQRLGRVRDLRPRLRSERPPHARRRAARAPLSARAAAQPHARHRRVHRQLVALAGERPHVLRVRREPSARSGPLRSASTATHRSGA